jgi:hypothetical protein
MTAMILLLSMFLLGAKCEQKLEEKQEQTLEEDTTQGEDNEDEESDEFFGGNVSNEQKTGLPGEETETDYSGSCTAESCESPAVCYKGQCKVPECVTDADCVDEDGCTPDKCEYAGHPNAFCSINVITLPRNNDGCCPVGAEVDEDVDCKPICGNHKCEYGESKTTCEIDCKNAGAQQTESAPPTGPTGPTPG